jgi:aspartyl-tRNA(Asn)/glutamyl-tRNA(Gln) amidotransferase subunit C
MPRVTLETVDHVAGLARLSLTAEEKALFARQLEEILEWAESLQALDTSGVPPMSHPHATSALRDDEPRAGLDQRAALESAPQAADGLFRVPRVIGG